MHLAASRALRAGASRAWRVGSQRTCGGVSQRWYSSSRQGHGGPPISRALVLGAAGCAGYGAFLYLSPSAGDRDARLPEVEGAAARDDIPVTSPVEALDLAAANQKIRQHVRTFTFEGRDGTQGRIDVARVSSNSPVEDDWAVGLGAGVGGDGRTLYAGVYDGHAGWATSTVLRESLIPYVASCLAGLGPSSSAEAVDAAIKGAFRALDDRIMDTARRLVENGDPGSPETISALAPAVAGSCALLSVYDTSSSTLRTAVTGDSRAVLGSWSSETGSFSADPLSVDQTGFNPAEVTRLCGAHPGEDKDMLDPRSGRLFGMAVTRAFGDHRWKWPLHLLEHLQANFFDSGPRPGYKTPPYMTAEPEVTTRRVGTDDFVIMASDGLWDNFSSEDAVACVSRWLAARRAGTPERQATAAAAGGRDPGDITAAREGSFDDWKATPDHFAIEDLDSAAVCLIKNAFGGTRRDLFRGLVGEVSPRSRYVRDDVTVQVIFFRDPYQ